MQRICIFAGSNPGKRVEYQEVARVLGWELVERGLELVYGGGSVGLMGVIADAVLEKGGKVTGVIPTSLFRQEVAHPGLTELHQVKSMHERKALMADLSDGFIALPGGFGTFDEFFEITTWAQIGLHRKPIGLLDVRGYFVPLLALVRHASEEGFIAPSHLSLLIHRNTPASLLDAFGQFKPSPIEQKWTELPLER